VLHRVFEPNTISSNTGSGKLRLGEQTIKRVSLNGYLPLENIEQR
jgi:hypothetical protein